MFSQVDLSRRACPALAAVPGLSWLALVFVAGTQGDFTLWSVVACVLSGILALRLIWCEALLRSPHSITRLQVHHNQLVAWRRNGLSTPVTIEDSSRLFARVALLKLRYTDTIDVPDKGSDAHHQYRQVQVLILNLPLCANVDSDAFRRLRVWIRFYNVTQ